MTIRERSQFDSQCVRRVVLTCCTGTGYGLCMPWVQVVWEGGMVESTIQYYSIIRLIPQLWYLVKRGKSEYRNVPRAVRSFEDCVDYVAEYWEIPHGTSQGIPVQKPYFCVALCTKYCDGTFAPVCCTGGGIFSKKEIPQYHNFLLLPLARPEVIVPWWDQGESLCILNIWRHLEFINYPPETRSKA